MNFSFKMFNAIDLFSFKMASSLSIISIKKIIIC